MKITDIDAVPIFFRFANRYAGRRVELIRYRLQACLVGP